MTKSDLIKGIKNLKNEDLKLCIILKLNNIKFNQDLDDELFTVRRMEKGL